MVGPRRPKYKEHDLVPIPEDVPGLGVEKGEHGLIEALDLRNDDTIATVLLRRSTGQPMGRVEMEIRPGYGILSCSPAG